MPPGVASRLAGKRGVPGRAGSLQRTMPAARPLVTAAALPSPAPPAGNQRAMLYVNAGLMNAPCSPSFVDVRDGILQAAVDNHGGEDVCRIWSAFAGMGLGVNALSGGANSTTPINGFAVPISCGGSPVPPVFGPQPEDLDVHAGYSAQFSVAGGALSLIHI